MLCRGWERKCSPLLHFFASEVLSGGLGEFEKHSSLVLCRARKRTWKLQYQYCLRLNEGLGWLVFGSVNGLKGLTGGCTGTAIGITPSFPSNHHIDGAQGLRAYCPGLFSVEGLGLGLALRQKTPLKFAALS